jgi:signal transduction histidine kinase/CheY-like chemotaxis protein
MKTLLVLAQHPDLAEAVRAGINPDEYRIIHRANLEESEPLLAHGLADACILDVELTTIQGVWLLEKLRRRAPRCPVIVYTGVKQWEWEEEAYLLGVSHVLAKPVRPRMLHAVLERLWAIPPPNPAMGSGTGSGGAAAHGSFETQEMIAAAASATFGPATSSWGSINQMFGPLRDFSGILMHSLDAEAMLNQFLILLRQLLSINRAVVFLAQPLRPKEDTPDSSRRFRSSAAIGLSAGLLQHFELSTETGIGGHVFRLGRVLRRSSEEVRNDPEAIKEFELLGVQVAVPMLDRERVLGVALFDGHITGEPLGNAELQLIFTLLEHLALATKNIWLHNQVVNSHEIMAEVMRELSSACIVVNRDLAILHANKMARRYFARSDRRASGELEFSDLPQILGAKIYQVLKTGAGLSNFKFQTEESPPTLYSINIVPFQREHGGPPASALLVAEDLTQAEQLKRLEIESAGLRQLKLMADRLTHEMGNATVRLSTYQQLLSERLGKKSAIDIDFLKLMASDWAEDTKRLRRFVNQLRCLNVDTVISEETFPVSALLEEAFQEAAKFQPVKASNFSCENGSSQKPSVLKGDRAALKLAFTEVLLNALQANPADPKVNVSIRDDTNGNGATILRIDIQDNGAGFTPDAVSKASAPFFTTRNVGLGLGLTVTRKIIETHKGKLEIVPPSSGTTGIVRISLPVSAEGATSSFSN